MSTGTLILLAILAAVVAWVVWIARRPGATGTNGETPVELAGRRDPPYTNYGGVTAPKFGSAGAGGAEHEPPTRVR